MRNIRIFIADDNTDFRERIKRLIQTEEGLEVVGESPDASFILNEVKASRADVVLLDVSMPGLNGLDAARILKEAMPSLKIITVSVYDIDEYKEAALSAGASTYMVKKDLMTQLIPKIKEGSRVDAQ